MYICSYGESINKRVYSVIYRMLNNDIYSRNVNACVIISYWFWIQTSIPNDPDNQALKAFCMMDDNGVFVGKLSGMNH